MFKDDPVCKKPDGGDQARIWRYMGLEKLVSLLDKGALFFWQGDKLLNDPFEGI